MGTHTETKDLIDILVTDHREVEQIFRELEDPGTTPHRKGQLATARPRR